MKKYYSISVALFIIMYLSVIVARIILGGGYVLPSALVILIGVIMLNSLIASVCMIYEMVNN